jgi:hypothetical protein
LLKIAEPVMNCKKGIMAQIQLSSIKQMAITFERHNSRNQSSTEPYIYFQQKSGWIPTTTTCSAITRRIPVGNHHEIYRTHENDYFNENAWNSSDLKAINEQLKGTL